jgi:hypothetical protein
MANHGTPSSKQLVLGDRAGLGQVHVDIEAFFELSFWLAEEIEDLVREWQKRLPRPTRHQTIPNYSRRTSSRPPR